MAFQFFQKNTNPEDSASKKLAIKQSRCPQNHACPAVKACPVNALSQTNYQAPVINEDKCIKCGKCVRVCPMRALVFG